MILYDTHGRAARAGARAPRRELNFFLGGQGGGTERGGPSMFAALGSLLFLTALAECQLASECADVLPSTEYVHTVTHTNDVGCLLWPT